jgi:DNA-binding HxlR family transcriptional regulator
VRSGAGAPSVLMVADRWAHLTLGAIFLGQQSFAQIRASLGVATNILAQRLAMLVAAGFLGKHRSEVDARSFVYRLTDRGRDVFPLTLSLVRWADRWMPNPHGPAMVRTHRTCGKPLDTEACCSACGDALHAWEVKFDQRATRALRTRETEVRL